MKPLHDDVDYQKLSERQAEEIRQLILDHLCEEESELIKQLSLLLRDTLFRRFPSPEKKSLT